MRNYLNTVSDWEQREKDRKKYVAETLQDIFANLKIRGVSEVVVEFDGSGDIGQVGQISADVDGILDELYLGGKSYRDFIDELTYDVLEGKGDWVNDEGGYGEVKFNILNNTVDTEMHIRITDTEDSEYSESIFS